MSENGPAEQISMRTLYGPWRGKFLLYRKNWRIVSKIPQLCSKIVKSYIFRIRTRDGSGDEVEGSGENRVQDVKEIVKNEYS